MYFLLSFFLLRPPSPCFPWPAGNGRVDCPAIGQFAMRLAYWFWNHLLICGRDSCRFQFHGQTQHKHKHAPTHTHQHIPTHTATHSLRLTIERESAIRLISVDVPRIAHISHTPRCSARLGHKMRFSAGRLYVCMYVCMYILFLCCACNRITIAVPKTGKKREAQKRIRCGIFNFDTEKQKEKQSEKIKSKEETRNKIKWQPRSKSKCTFAWLKRGSQIGR